MHRTRGRGKKTTEKEGEGGREKDREREEKGEIGERQTVITGVLSTHSNVNLPSQVQTDFMALNKEIHSKCLADNEPAAVCISFFQCYLFCLFVYLLTQSRFIFIAVYCRDSFWIV